MSARCPSCGLFNLPGVVACRRCGAPTAASPPSRPDPVVASAGGPTGGEASCSLRARRSTAALFIAPSLLFVALSFSPRIARGGDWGVPIAASIAFAFGAFWSLRPRVIRVAGGRLTISGALRTSEASVKDVRRVALRQHRGPRGTTTRTLVFEVAGAARPLWLELPLDAEPDRDLPGVFAAIAAQSERVEFDAACDRIRAGRLVWS